MKFIPLKLRFSQKASILSRQKPPTYILEVPLAANKVEIAAAVAATYNVKVDRVRTLRQNGKPALSRQFSRQQRRQRSNLIGRRANFKKAYVTLAAGEEIADLPDSARI